jgi:acetyl-CoA C-acetyltransferase
MTGRSRAAIVATARTPIGRAYRGAFNNTSGVELAAHAIASALSVVDLDPALVDDVVMGCALQQGSTGFNVARQALLRAKLPATVPGATIDRQCSSGLMAVAAAARQILVDGMRVTIGGGVESISLVQNEHMNGYRVRDQWLADNMPTIYMPMLQTAELVAERYAVNRERQDEMGLKSHQRAAAAHAAGIFDAEIVPMTVRTLKTDKETGESVEFEQTISADEGVRPDTTAERLAGLRTVLKPGEVTKQPSVTAGNSSQLSDGASANVVMDSEYAAALGIPALGYYCGISVTGCEPDEMGIGPVTAIPRLLKQHGLRVDDIGVWELNEAFASQAVYCRDCLGIDPEKMNVNGGAIALGHPYGMTGARAVGHALLEARRRDVQFAVVSMCVGGGMGAAGLFELA